MILLSPTFFPEEWGFQNTNIPACSSADTTLEDTHHCCEEGSSHQGSPEHHPFHQPSPEEAGSKEGLEVDHMGFAAKQTLVTAPPKELEPISLQPPPHSHEVESRRGEPCP